jgi:hypothetical protein
MLKSFSQFINEDRGALDFLSGLTTKLIQKIRSSKEEQDYTLFSGMEFREPFEFDLIMYVRKDSNPNIKNDAHFSELPWEEINFENDGYAIDAKVRIHKEKSLIPEISIYIIINPNQEPHVYRDLFSRLLDILVHETKHIEKISIKRNPFNVKPSNHEERNAAKKSHNYFLLPDEIESMVEGMLARSKYLDIPLDYIFDDYLIPFVQSKYITPSEYEKVKIVWIKHALEKHPDANFSKKVEKIVNSI